MLVLLIYSLIESLDIVFAAMLTLITIFNSHVVLNAVDLTITPLFFDNLVAKDHITDYLIKRGDL